jgi:hypothetical protein
MSNKIYYSKTALTGGAEAALDYIDGDLLTDGDVAHVMVSGILYTYKLNASSSATEAAPHVITPDTNPGTKRWLLQQTIPYNSQGVFNLKPVVNAAVNKLDIFSKSGGAAPTDTNMIAVAIPDANGHTVRTRGAAYLSGTSQIVMANATSYWNKGSVASEIKTAWLYAIWDGTGIVWALGGYSGFTTVSTTTTVTDADYLLLEAGSTYVRNASHRCVAVAKIRYEYDTADDPDHTIQASGENSPQVIWNPKSDYAGTSTYPTTLTQASNITLDSYGGAYVKQSGKYRIVVTAAGYGEGAANQINAEIRTGSAAWASATVKSQNNTYLNVTGAYLSIMTTTMCYLNAGDYIHLGAGVASGGGNRSLFGNNTYVGGTKMMFQRID